MRNETEIESWFYWLEYLHISSEWKYVKLAKKLCYQLV